MINFILFLAYIFLYGVAWIATAIFWYRWYKKDMDMEAAGFVCGMFWFVFWFCFLLFQTGRKLGHFISDNCGLEPLRK